MTYMRLLAALLLISGCSWPLTQQEVARLRDCDALVARVGHDGSPHVLACVEFQRQMAMKRLVAQQQQAAYFRALAEAQAQQAAVRKREMDCRPSLLGPQYGMTCVER